MRFRLAAIVLTAAVCGLVAPARAAEPAADLGKYMPDNTAMYLHVNVRQFLAAPVIRKAIPLAMDKYGDTLMQFAQMAKAFDPNAANVPNDQIKSVIDELKKPATIAKAFDAAKDGLADIVVVGKEDSVLVLLKCHEAVTADLVKGFTPLLNGNPQLQVTTSGKDDKTVFEVTIQQQQKFYFGIPTAGVVVGGMAKDLVEKSLAGGGGGLKADLKKLVAERKPTDFVFFATAGKRTDDSSDVSGWGRLVLDANISGEMTATFATAAKAADHAKELDDHISQMAGTVKDALGPAGKDVAAALEKAKPVTAGSTVSSKFSLNGSVIEKLLAK